MARHAIADHLAAHGVSPDVRDDALLVVSELVSNAIKHAAPLDPGVVQVQWSVEDDVVHVSATDGGSATRPTAVVAAVSEVGGRGLDIVRTISSRWGVIDARDSVTVWADLPRGQSLAERGYVTDLGASQRVLDLDRR